MVKLNQGLTLGVLLVVIVVMVVKPNLLGFLYNNTLGKLIFVAAIVFLSLKHTVAGLLAVVFVAIVASMTGHLGFEGFEGEAEEKEEEEKEGFSECKGEDCKTTEGAENQKKEEKKEEKKEKSESDIISQIAKGMNK